MTEIKQTLERMLEAEKQAQSIVSEAEKQARTILDNAHRRAAEVMARTREEAQREAAKTIDDAVAEARAEKARRLEEVRRKLQSLPELIPAARKNEAADVLLKAFLASDG